MDTVSSEQREFKNRYVLEMAANNQPLFYSVLFSLLFFSALILFPSYFVEIKIHNKKEVEIVDKKWNSILKARRSFDDNAGPTFHELDCGSNYDNKVLFNKGDDDIDIGVKRFRGNNSNWTKSQQMCPMKGLIKTIKSSITTDSNTTSTAALTSSSSPW